MNDSEVHRRARVLNHGVYAGLLEELADGSFRFAYDPAYLLDPRASAISLTLPLRRDPCVSPKLFPFFSNLLSEGATRELQARLLKVDEADAFALLIATGRDLVGSVTIEGDA